MRHITKAWIVGITLAAGAGVMPTTAQAGIGINIDIAPPAPRIEEVPPPRPGYVWAPGYWDYRHNQHVWARGRYVHERRGYHWEPDRWEQQGPHWHRQRGHWER